MLRVLYVSAVAERGGLEVILANILRSLDRSRFAPAVALLEDGPFARELRDAGTETWVIESGRVRNVIRVAGAIARLARLIRHQRIDIVHTMNAKAHLFGGSAAALCRVPCVYHLHGVPRPNISRDGMVSFLSVVVPATRTIACSSYVAEGFRRTWGPRRRVTVVHNGVFPWSANQEAPTVRREFGIADSEPLVVMVARLQRWKGVHVFVDAAAQVARRRPDARFLVVGGTLFGLEQEYATGLCASTRGQGLDGALTFVGYRSDAGRFFEEADIVVHASIEPDPFPTVLLEAMAAGKPVVASDLGGPREIVLPGETGFLVPPNRADLLAESILTLVEDSALRARMGQRAAERFEADFLASRMAQDLQEIYLHVVSRSAPSRRHSE